MIEFLRQSLISKSGIKTLAIKATLRDTIPWWATEVVTNGSLAVNLLDTISLLHNKYKFNRYTKCLFSCKYLNYGLTNATARHMIYLSTEKCTFTDAGACI
jgi:hypothetical protein